MDFCTTLHARCGQTLLTLVTLVGGIIVVTGTVFVVLSLSLSASAYQFRASQSAEAVANAGIEDAMLQLTRNMTFSSAGYSVPVGSWTTTVVVTQGSPSAGYVTATSLTTVSGNTRKLSAIFTENTTTTQVNLVSIQTIQ